MRKIARVDGNQTEIVDTLRGAGASVHHTHQLGGGFPDVAVGWSGITYLCEIKVGNAGLTEDEQKFFDEWRGHVTIIRTPEQALKMIGVI